MAVVLMVCFVLSMSSCGAGKSHVVTELSEFKGFENTEYNMETDYQYYFSDMAFAASDSNGYYIYGVQDMAIYYVDRETMEVLPLCSRADCMHNSEDCNASVFLGGTIRYNDGYIYYVETRGEDCLYRIKNDGSVKEKVCNVITEADINVAGLGIHRNYLLYSMESVKDSKDVCYLYKVDLKTKKTEMVYEYENKAADMYRFTGYGDGVLFIRSCALDDDYTEFKNEVCYYDYNTGEISIVLEGMAGDFTIAEDNIYFYDDGGVYKYDTHTKERSLFYPIDEFVYISYDGENLYLDNCWDYNMGFINESDVKNYVVNFDGELVTEIPISFEWPTFGDKYYLLNHRVDGFYFFDKSKLSTSEGKWIAAGK